MNEGYVLQTMSPEERRELLEKAIEKSLKTGTWPMLLAAIGMVMSIGDNQT